MTMLATESTSAPAEVRCASCGKRDHPHDPLPWQMTEGPCDMYCDACYRQLRRHEQAEEAIVAAIRSARIHETYTPKLIREALDGIASTDPQWFDLLMQRGAAYPWQRRGGTSIATESDPGAEKDGSNFIS